MTKAVPNDLEPGVVVYKPFQPRKIGRVLKRTEVPMEDRGRTWSNVSYRVRWEDGTVTEVLAYHLNVLYDLIETHQKALRTHRASMKRGLTIPLD